MKKARFFYRSNCTTCRDARIFLRSELHIELDERDYARNPLTFEELRAIFAGRDPRAFLNPKSPAHKAMGLAGKDLSPQQALELMVQEPLLIKRPLIAAGQELIAGFDRTRLRQLLG